ncbi:MAG TPA: DUF927 domain-containing protein [Rhizomicrobium sp.]|nr:DUF927 domain-containing protein [Rhizomicrobium sp.]
MTDKALKDFTPEEADKACGALLHKLRADERPDTKLIRRIFQLHVIANEKATGDRLLTKTVHEEIGGQISLDDLRGMLKECRESHKRVAPKAERETAPALDTKAEELSDRLAALLSQTLGRKFPFPSDHHGEFYLAAGEGTLPWLYRRSADEKRGDTRLCTPFVLAGVINYADREGERGLRIEVCNEHAKWEVVDINAADLATMTGVDALRAMMARGLGVTRAGKNFISDYLSESRPKGPTVYDRPGFRGDGFVCPTGEVLLTREKVELSGKTRLKCAATRGSLEKWKEGVQGVCGLPIDKAYHFQAGIIMGFAGVLANLAGDDMLGYSLEDESQTGKSSTQAGAVSSWCDPSLKESKGLFMPAKGTDNSHEAALQKGAGTVIALDEFGRLSAKVQQDIIFMAQGGAGKRRLKSDSEERATRGWQGGTLIVSAETGFAQRLALEGEKQAGGAAVRMVPISTAHITGKLDGRQFAHVTKVIENFGWSGPVFVLALEKMGFIQKRSRIKQYVAYYVIQMERTTGPDNAYRASAARHFGYLWMAGLLAQDAELIPEDFDVKALIAKLWRHALDSDSGPTDPNAKALAHLVDAITARKDADIVALSVLNDDKRYRREAAGYYDDLRRRYIIRIAAFDQLSGGTVSGKGFRAYLDKLGYLVKPVGKTDSRTWSGYPGLGKDAQYVVLDMDKIDCPTVLPALPRDIPPQLPPAKTHRNREKIDAR